MYVLSPALRSVGAVAGRGGGAFAIKIRQMGRGRPTGIEVVGLAVSANFAHLKDESVSESDDAYGGRFLLLNFLQRRLLGFVLFGECLLGNHIFIKASRENH